MEFIKYLSSKNVNVFLNIGMGCIIIHLFYEMNKLKKQIKLLQSLNSPKKLTLDDVKDKENIDLVKSVKSIKHLEDERMLSQPTLAPSKIPVDRVGQVNQARPVFKPVKRVDDIKTEEIKVEKTELDIPEISELKADESEIPIYSNDNDELMSIEMTDKMSEKDTILSEISTTSIEDKKMDNVAVAVAVAVVEEVEEVVKEETNVDSETKSDINKDELMKMRKNDILKLANEFKLSTVKDNNGKVKKKTKSELVEDILSANN